MGDNAVVSAPNRTSDQVARIEPLRRKGMNGQTPQWMLDELGKRYKPEQVTKITGVLREDELRLFLDHSGHYHPEHAFAFAEAIVVCDSFENRFVYCTRYRVKPDFKNKYQALWTEWVETHKTMKKPPREDFPWSELELKIDLLREKLPSLFHVWYCKQFPDEVVYS